jgi:hypothetical protein
MYDNTQKTIVNCAGLLLFVGKEVELERQNSHKPNPKRYSRNRENTMNQKTAISAGELEYSPMELL